jgi:hypothetical protein
MRIEREVLRLQMLGGFVVGQVVEQDRAQNGTLGFNVCGQSVRETVISGCLQLSVAAPASSRLSRGHLALAGGGEDAPATAARTEATQQKFLVNARAIVLTNEL